MSRTFEALQQIEKHEAPSAAPARLTIASPAADRAAAKSVRVGEEEVLKLVQRVFRSTSSDAPHVVVFSGVGHGDGCSWITANAALTLAAQTTASVCVVDANLRTPSLHHAFAVENHFGLVESIAQPGAVRNFARQVGNSNLWVLTCGSLAPSSPAAPLSSEGLRARIADLRAEFDYVLIDTPPTNLYADAITLGRLSDGIILVLQSNATKRDAAMKAKESCEIAHVRLLGAVLNKRTFPIPQHVYDRL